MKITLIDCSLPINTRNEKLLRSFSKYVPEAELHVITWSRENKKVVCDSLPEVEFHVYEKASPLQNLKKKFVNMFGFKRFIGRQLKTINPDIVIASHWSNLILTSGYIRHGQKLIYENLDVPTESFIIRKLTEFFERISLRRTDFIIYASRFFEPLYPKRIPHFILENKPMFGVCPFEPTPVADTLRVAYLGVVRYLPILQNLVDAVRGDDRIELVFHGNGAALEAIEQYSSGCTNITFTGRYSYQDIIGLYQKADIVWAAYPNHDYNVVYAISNKFHESLFVGVPCIYSSRTKLADFAVEHNIGLEVDPYSKQSISDLFSRILSGETDIAAIRRSMTEFQKYETTWDEDFIELLKLIIPNRPFAL